MELADIVSLGYASVDHFIRVTKYPSMGQKIPYHSYTVLGGGQAATASIAISRWGATSRFVGRVGDDATGDQSIQWLQQAGVICDSALKTPGVTSQTAYIIVPDDCGERTVIWNRQPGLNLSAEDLQPLWFRNTKVLFVDGHELDAAVRAARWVRENGGKVVLDAEHIGNDRGSLLSLTDIAVGSEDFGLREFGTADPEETIAVLRQAGVGFAGVTLGNRGSLADWGEGVRRFRAIDVNVVDTTGAGDIFHAALAYAAFKGMQPDRMMTFATVAAGLSCEALGGRSAIPACDAVLDRMQQEGSLEISL